jgi:hypothetical protein
LKFAAGTATARHGERLIFEDEDENDDEDERAVRPA